MVDLDKIIDELDKDALTEFHKKLLENGCYQGLLNVNEIDQLDLGKLRDTVKVGVQGAGYEKLRDIGPESIKREIESIDNEPVIVQDPPEEADASDTPPTGLQASRGAETKEKLLQELIHISSLRKPGVGVPPQYIERYGEILTTLNEKHYMTQLEIQKETSISDKAVRRAITQYKKEHPIERPDDRVVSKSESKVAQKLTEKVTEKADNIIEEDMALAIHIRETYLKEAYMRGIGLMELVDTAIPIWFNIEGIYNTMLNMERETISLKEHIKSLETEKSELIRRNRILNQRLLSLNAIIA